MQHSNVGLDCSLGVAFERCIAVCHTVWVNVSIEEECLG